MTTDYWKPHEPNGAPAWNRSQVLHVYHRLGFSCTPAELSRSTEMGFAATIQGFLKPESAEVDAIEASLIRQAIDRNDVCVLEAGWIRRMWHCSNPLVEQQTLMWHNHFATSFLKVRDCDAMWSQNQLFRRLGRGHFADLLKAVLRDRAMLIWLDGDSNRAAHPNENLARELMELFTIGEGHYDEHDVQEAARALTGWRVDDSGVHFESAEHDGGIKTILGKTAAHNVDTLADVLIAHPATAERIAWRLCDHFLGTPVPQVGIDQLAGFLRKSDLHIDKAMEKLVLSERFHSREEMNQRFRSPVSIVVGGIRELGLHEETAGRPAVQPQLAASWMASMGQRLFHPPGVAGWQGGTAWLGSQSMIRRAAFAQALSQGQLSTHPYRTPEALQLASASAQLD
ncbi:DUF1800 domain-containing protein [Roseiconus nitratireducens]|uniref:DUF1800 domain-containing protein n=1 Tax=Roseiconus nitratireducens TaxID=2605748 RepID=A0A5M6CSP4_9BACT|nr:DUF1800 domain-containing protein [Roseiconus nitratireducens]KAA5537966.1 DUF1800 domain-containing protein [Roseiconus nitratireducens]